MRRPLALASLFILLPALLSGLYWYQHRRTATRRLAAWQEQQKEAATRERLERLITLEGGPMPLSDFAALIEKHSGLAVEFDEPSLAITRYPTQPATTIPVQVPKGTLTIHSALLLTLHPKGLWADLRGNSLLITTSDNSRDRIRLETAVYPLPPNGPAGMDEEAWRELVDANLPRPWVPRGYTEMTTHVEAVPGALVVVHTADGHRRIRQIIAAICGLGDSQEQQSPITIPPPPLGTVERQILAALDHPTTLELVETPLSDAVNYLAEQHGILIILMVQKLKEASVSTDIPITKNLKDISLRSALRLMLNDLELTYVLRDEALLITTPEDAESQLRAIAYPAKDLLGDDANIDRLIDVITTALAPQSWREVGGPGLIRGVSNDWLLVSQTNDVHEQVVFFLDRLHRMLAGSDRPLMMHSSAADEADEKIRQALKQEIELDFVSMPLRDVVAFLQEKLQISIVLAARKLEEASVSPDTPITCQWPSGRAGLYLELLLKDLELTSVVRDEVLQITTPEDAESQLITRLYDARGLAAFVDDPQRLCDMIESVVSPQTWSDVGGPGSIPHFRGILVVSQTRDVHDQIDRLLSALKTTATFSPGLPQSSMVPIHSSPAHQRVEAALDRPVSVDFQNVPLDEALNHLATPRHLFLLIDRKSLDEVGVMELPRVTFRATDMTLGGVLDRLLSPLALGYSAREHALVISSENHSGFPWEIRLHRISEVPAFRIDDPTAFRDSFRATLNAMLGRHPTPSGELSGLNMEVVNSDWIIIDASRRWHEYIADWLMEQRTGQIPKRELERRALKKDLETGMPTTPSR